MSELKQRGTNKSKNKPASNSNNNTNRDNDDNGNNNSSDTQSKSVTAESRDLNAYFSTRPYFLQVFVSSQPDQLHIYISYIVLLITFIIYYNTVYKSISGGDSGELTICACNFGIAHPPGYPTYTILAGIWLRIFKLLCGFEAAYAVNLFNSFCASLCRVLSSLLFSFSGTVWLYSIQGEVFALNNLFTSLMAYYTVKYYYYESKLAQYNSYNTLNKIDDSNSKNNTYYNNLVQNTINLSYIGAFICGLAMTNQHTTVFYVIPTVLFVVYSLYSNNLLSPKSILYLCIALFVGMSPYLYIIIRSHWQVIDSWGDQRTLDGFLTHFLRKEYGTFQLAASEISNDPGMISRLKVYLNVTLKETLYITIPLSLIGCISLILSKYRNIRLCNYILLLSYLLYMIVFHKLANLDLRPLFLGVQARFWQQPNMYIIIWAAIGIYYIVTIIMEKIIKIIDNTSNIFNKKNIILLIITIIFSSSQIMYHYNRSNHNNNDSFYRVGIKQLNSFPNNTIVLLNGDLNNNMLKYPNSCENIRSDIDLLSLQLMSWNWYVPIHRDNYPRVIFPGNRYHIITPGSFNIKKFLDKNMKKNKKNIFLCGPFKEGDYSNYKDQLYRKPEAGLYYDEWPYGECSQLLPSGTKPNNLTQFLIDGLNGLARITELPVYDKYKFGDDSWENVLYTDAAQRLAYLASYASFHSNKNLSDAPLLHLAKSLQDEIMHNTVIHSFLTEKNAIRPDDYRTAGVIYGNYALHMKKINDIKQEKEANRYMFEAWLRFVQLTPNDQELRPYLNDAINPYTGQSIDNIDDLKAEFDKLNNKQTTTTATTTSNKNANTNANTKSSNAKSQSTSTNAANTNSQPTKASTSTTNTNANTKSNIDSDKAAQSSKPDKKSSKKSKKSKNSKKSDSKDEL